MYIVAFCFSRLFSHATDAEAIDKPEAKIIFIRIPDKSWTLLLFPRPKGK
jgi:hypothetical protein